ncbi:hypothetical protein FRB91_008873 [Serendipita sp. 411]|nr:hypothetical protein FRB91_008873 [Serendipita sp. 411]
MGQYFDIVNLDGRTFVEYTKFGEVWSYDSFACFATDYWWIGSRLIFLGGPAERFPPGVLTAEEKKESLEAISSGRWARSFTECNRPINWELDDQEELVLVNLSSCEYIRGDLFTGKPARARSGSNEHNNHPGLDQALLARITWTHDPNMNIGGPRLWNYGSWAGSRVGIKYLKDYQDRNGYKDITEVVFYEAYTVWDMDLGLICNCALCEKYLQMKQNGFDPYKEPERQQNDLSLGDDSRPETIPGVEHLPTSSKPVNTSYMRAYRQPRYFPLDIQCLIFAELPPSSLAACALVCRGFVHEAIRALYRNVSMRSALHMNMLLDILKMEPFKTYYIQHLSLQLRIMAVDRDTLHSILKELPNLKHLTLSPCWISYGDASIYDYPFQLHSLYWGLIPDLSMNLFLRSQPSIQNLEFPEGYDPISDWFRFWPDLLPNLRSATATKGMLRALRDLEVVKNHQCQLKVQPDAYNAFLTERYKKWVEGS